MKLDYYLRKVRELPPRETIKRTLKLCRNQTLNFVYRLKDRYRTSYAENSSIKYLYRYLPKLQLSYLKPHEDQIYALADHFLEHRFDLLGSGWVQVKHGMRCRGLEGHRYDMGDPIQIDTEGKWLEGRINSANLEESKRIWKLISAGSSKLPRGMIPGFHWAGKAQSSKDQMYVPIDWHLDFKSGYRWSESMWYKNIPFGHKLGVDVKVPWELARMQHLSQLAYAYALSAQRQNECDQENIRYESQIESPDLYAWEFRNQVLDFISTNPPRYGVNWFCAMDVGIRVANWLVAYDLFRTSGFQFDDPFEKVFFKSIYEHSFHIINNFELNDSHRGNHYLSNIVGLLFVAAYLPCTKETDAWIAFAVQELINEVDFQFNPDGSNFEASTSYHRLSAEMVVYATALTLVLPDQKLNALKNYDHRAIEVKPGLKKSPIPFYSFPVRENSEFKTQDSKLTSPFPIWYFERLEKMAEFTMYITKPNSHIPQIGDNDSGRFFKFQPVYEKMTVTQAKKRYLNLEGYEELPGDALYWDEDFLDHRHLIAAINGLYDRGDFSEFVGSNFYETEIVNNLVKGMTLVSHKKFEDTLAAENIRIDTEQNTDTLLAEFNSCAGVHRRIYEIPIPGDGLLDGLKLYAYPDFGLYIYHSKRLYLAVRCGPIDQNGSGGHAHNDQLSIELNVDGNDWIIDPGTYLYTPLPESRNKYRSVKSHFAPSVDNKEPRAMSSSLFQLNVDGGECLYFVSNGFVGRYRAYGDKIIFIVTLEQNIGLRIYTVNQKNQPFSFPHQYPFTLNDGVYVFGSVGSCPPGWSPSYGKETAFYSRAQV